MYIVCVSGFLDPSSDSEHIQKGAQLEVPFWLARSLCSRRKHTVSIELPKQYREGYREILSAEASVVDLHKWGPYFYKFGSHLLHFEHPESPSIAKALLQVSDQCNYICMSCIRVWLVYMHVI